jgi:hypothetical protein
LVSKDAIEKCVFSTSKYNYLAAKIIKYIFLIYGWSCLKIKHTLIFSSLWLTRCMLIPFLSSNTSLLYLELKLSCIKIELIPNLFSSFMADKITRMLVLFVLGNILLRLLYLRVNLSCSEINKTHSYFIFAFYGW